MNLNAYVPNPNQWIDPLGLMDIYAIGLNTVSGYKTEYKMNFKDSWIKHIGYEGPGRLGTIVGIGTATAAFISPEPISCDTGFLGIPGSGTCIDFDKKFKEAYEKMFGTKERLSETEMKRYMDHLYYNHGYIMSKYYGHATADSLIKQLKENLKNHKVEKILNPQAGDRSFKAITDIVNHRNAIENAVK